jgi:hypothetical protein
MTERRRSRLAALLALGVGIVLTVWQGVQLYFYGRTTGNWTFVLVVGWVIFCLEVSIIAMLLLMPWVMRHRLELRKALYRLFGLD